MKQFQILNKKVYIAQTAGFCMGVKRAVQMAIKGRVPLQEKLYTFGPLVHNEQVIEVLESLGIHCLSTKNINEEISSGEKNILIRAHGVPPGDIDFLEQKGFSVRDATCPHVTRAQRIAARYSQKGYHCIIFGDANHSEVKGILGYTCGKGHALPDARSFSNLNLHPDTPICILSQTTQEKKQFQTFVSEIQKNFKKVEVKDTICNATEARQNELKNLVKEVDLLIILGGKHSGNTRRLYEIGKERLTNTIWVETPFELKKYKKLLLESEKIGISAGASTPQWIIDAIQEKIEQIVIRQKNILLSFMYDFLRMLIRLSLMVGLAAGFSALFWSSFFQAPFQRYFFPLTVLYVFSMYFGHRLKEIEYKDPSHFKVYRKYEKFLWAFLFAILFIGTSTAFFVSVLTGMTYGALALAGMAYIFPRHSFFLKRLHTIPGSKDFAVSLAWAFLAVVLPAKSIQLEFSVAVVFIAFTYMASAVFFRMLLLDLLDFQSDRIMGRDTLITILPQKKYRNLLRSIWLLNLSCLLLLVPWMQKWAVLLLIPSFGLLGNRLLVNKRPHTNRYLFETFLDGIFVLPAFIGVFI